MNNLSEIINIVLAVIAIVLTVLYRLNDRKRKMPYYVIKNDKLISSNQFIKGVRVFYENNQIEHLTRTEFLFFNVGNSTIHFHELGKSIGLKLKFSDRTLIYSIETLDVSSTNINLEYIATDNSIDFSFDYLKRNSFFHISILSNEINLKSIELLGELIEDVNIKKYTRTSYLLSSWKYATPYIFFGGILIAIFNTFLNLSTSIIVIGGFFLGFVIPDLVYSTKKPIQQKLNAMFIDR